MTNKKPRVEHKITYGIDYFGTTLLILVTLSIIISLIFIVTIVCLIFSSALARYLNFYSIELTLIFIVVFSLYAVLAFLDSIKYTGFNHLVCKNKKAKVIHIIK